MVDTLSMAGAEEPAGGETLEELFLREIASADASTEATEGRV